MGLMQDTIQENLNIITTDGRFNEASIRKASDTKYPSVMKKSNPIDVVFKDKAKFDAQNLVIGTLLAQVNNEDKKKEKAFLNQLSGVLSITDLNIRKRLQELKDFNEGRVNDDDDDDNNNDGGIDLPPPPTALQTPRRDIFPSPPYTPSSDDDDDLNAAQHSPVAEPICQELTRTTPQ